MARPRRKAAKSPPAALTVVVMRLYIAAGSTNSVKAVANLDAICREYLKEGYELEIVDVIKYPLRALTDGVLVTPSLAKLSPAPTARVAGNLSDKSSLLRALGIKAPVK